MDIKHAKFFTKSLLIQAIREGEIKGYNRQAKWSLLDRFNEDERALVTYAMPHYYIKGVRATPHVRTWVMFAPGEKVFIDISEKLFKQLPNVDLSENVDSEDKLAIA